jgi:hypothetical protein
MREHQDLDPPPGKLLSSLRDSYNVLPLCRYHEIRPSRMTISGGCEKLIHDCKTRIRLESCTRWSVEHQKACHSQNAWLEYYPEVC